MDGGDQKEEPRPGNFDRAWNDPPLFSYKPAAQGPNKLNKRVMHPVPSGSRHSNSTACIGR